MLRIFVTTLVLSATLSTTELQKDLLVALKFVPQEHVRAISVALPGSILDRPLEIKVDDTRAVDDPRVIGAGTDDDDRPFPIKSSVDVPQFVRDAVVQITSAYSIKTAATADRKLTLRLTRFVVNESNKALGSTYLAEVHLAYTLADGAGKVIAESASAGSATRYGRARSGANCSEVLSDALKDAFGKIMADRPLQDAWRTGAVASADGVSVDKTLPQPKESVEERLLKLNDLLKKGLITQEEYKVKRAEILKDA